MSICGKFYNVTVMGNPRLIMLRGRLIDLLHIHRQSAYLIGRDRFVADITLEHPSCSKQHAAIQCMLSFPNSFSGVLIDFHPVRQIQNKNEFGDVKSTIKFVLSP